MKIMLKDEKVTKEKEATTYLKLLSKHFPALTEENHKTLNQNSQ
jgi:hypothetical protein